MIGLVNGTWRVLCQGRNLLLTAAAECDTRTVASEIALTSYPLGTRLPAVTQSSNGHLLLVIAAAVLVAWAVIVLVILRRAPNRSRRR